MLRHAMLLQQRGASGPHRTHGAEPSCDCRAVGSAPIRTAISSAPALNRRCCRAVADGH